MIQLKFLTSSISLVFLVFSSVSFGASFESSLVDLMNSIDKVDYAVKRAHQDVESQKIELTRARTRFAPSASISSSISEGDDFAGHSLDLNLNLFRGLSDYYNLKTRKVRLAKSENQLLTVRRNTRADAGRRFINLIDLKTQKEIQQQEVELRLSALKIMVDRFKKGLVAEGEVLKLNVDAHNSKVQLQQVQENLINEIATLSGESGYPLSEVNLPVFPTPPQSLSLNVTQLAAEIENNSTDFSNRKFDVEIEKLELSSAKHQIYSPSLNAFYSYDNNAGFGNNGNPYEYDSSAGLSLSIPLFSQLNDYSDYKQRKVDSIKSQLFLDETKRDLRLDLNERITTLNTLLETIKLQRESEELATRFYKQSLERFRLGLISTNDMSFDQQRLTQAKLRLSRLQRDYYRQVLDLNLLLGRPLSASI